MRLERTTSARARAAEHQLVRASMALAGLLLLALIGPSVALAGGFNTPGNLLIADQFNNRVIELNESGRIVWHFGNGQPVAGPRSLVAPQSVQRLPYKGMTLITCGSVLAGTPGYPAGGVIDGRVIIVNRKGRIVWRYGRAGVAGAGPGELNDPVDARWSPGDDIMITDQGNQRVIEVSAKKKIIWSYGTVGSLGSGPGQLDHPASAERVWTNKVLIADQGNDRVIMVKGETVSSSYGAPGQTDVLNAPASARLLPSGRLLIVDSGNSRVIRVRRDKTVIWSYVTSARAGSISDPGPSDAVVRPGGQTLISDGLNQQVIELSYDGMMVWSYGALGMPGQQWGQLNAPRGLDLVPRIRVFMSPLRVHGSG